MLSFLNLKYFLFLADEMNFRSAAKKLHITQQSLSGHIKKLETYFGVTLFKYGPPLEITPAGLLLKKHALEMLKQEHSLETDLQNLKTLQRGTLVVGCTYARAQYLLPPVIAEFQSKYPLINLQLVEGNTPDVEEALKKNLVDVAIGYVPKNLKDITSLPLYKDDFRLVVHPELLARTFPTYKHQPLIFKCYNEDMVNDIMRKCPLLTMTPNTTIGTFVHEYLKNLGIQVKPFLVTKDVSTLLSMCYSGLGYMLCLDTFINHSSYAFSQRHLIYPLIGEKPIQIALNYQTAKQSSPNIKAFIAIATELLRDKNTKTV